MLKATEDPRNRLPSWVDRQKTAELPLVPDLDRSRRSRTAADQAMCETMAIQMPMMECLKCRLWHKSKSWPTRLPTPTLKC